MGECVLDSTYKRVINKHAFVGIISSDSFEEEFKSYGKYLSDYFNSGGRMICINSKGGESKFRLFREDLENRLKSHT